MSQADLEISLYRRDAGTKKVRYGIELRFTDPGSEAEKRQGGAGPVRFDAAELRQRADDPAAYGQYLASQLLAEPAVRGFFDQAVAVAQAQDVPLRLRLNVAPGAPELHSLRWETLRLPGATAPLLTGENLRFSRFLSSLDWRPVRLRSEGDLTALVAVAAPSDVTRYKLAPVDRDKELTAARGGLGDIATVELATRGQATLANLAARLRDGYDILYLVAHGMLVDGEPWLFLEKEDGTTDKVPGRELATRIQELDDRPRLVVLVSCQGAGAGGVEPTARDGGELAGLGPRLAEAGVPAVIAMQGNVTMKTAAAFTPVFFTELRRDGLVDRAMAVARGAVRDRPDWWMPVLFTRLRDGQLWEPGPPEPPRLDFEPEMIYVPTGPFLMGTDPGEGIPEYETPQHTVTLPAYRIGRFPVTNRQYAEFIRREKAQDVPKDAGYFLREPPADRLDHPVTGVSWGDAVAYCRWLSSQSKRRYRLPAETEWEKAARGLATGLGPGRCYPWGDEWDATRANAGSAGTTPVMAHPAGASPPGCEDMLGNVQEWTASLWGTQPAQPQRSYRDQPAGGPSMADPADLPAQARLVHRGGSYKSQPGELRCSARGNATPDSRIPWRGFRVAMEV